MPTLDVTVKIPQIPRAQEIVSLCHGGPGQLYGGFTGARGRLFFRYDIAEGAFVDLGDRIVSAPEITSFSGRPISQKIHHALERLPDGRIAGATGQNFSIHTLYTDLDEGGHVFLYDPGSDRADDLGVPCPHEWIINMTADAAGRNLYGMSYPLNHVFRVELPAREMRVVGQPMAGTYGDSGPCHQCCCDPDGNLYGSGAHGHIWKYDVRKDRIEPTAMRLPEGALRIDSFVPGPDGRLYAGTWERGDLLRIDPRQGKLEVLGRPGGGPRLPAMAFAPDGCLYGAAGGGQAYKGRNAFLFRYDPATGRIDEIGTIRSRQQGILAERIHTMAVDDDGVLYCGETGSRYVQAGEVAVDPYLYVCRITQAGQPDPD